MRFLPCSKHYLCRKCGFSFLMIFNRWLFKRHQRYRAASS